MSPFIFFDGANPTRRQEGERDKQPNGEGKAARNRERVRLHRLMKKHPELQLQSRKRKRHLTPSDFQQRFNPDAEEPPVAGPSSRPAKKRGKRSHPEIQWDGRVPDSAVPRHVYEIDKPTNNPDGGLLQPEFSPEAPLSSIADVHTTQPPVTPVAFSSRQNNVSQYNSPPLTLDVGLQEMETMVDVGVQKMETVGVGIQTKATMADIGVQTMLFSLTDASVEALPVEIPTFGTPQEGSSAEYLAQFDGVMHGNPPILKGNPLTSERKNLGTQRAQCLDSIEYRQVNVILAEYCEDLLDEIRVQREDIPAIIDINRMDQGYTAMLRRQFEDRQIEIRLEIPTINLTLSVNPNSTGSITCYDEMGHATEYYPPVHRKEQLTALLELRNKLEHLYFDEKPKYLSDPDHSMFRIISGEDEIYMSPKKVQKILQGQHIVVTNIKSHTTTFDRRGLETLSPLHAVVNIDDQDLPWGTPLSERVRSETLEQFIDSYESANKRILRVAHMKSSCQSHAAPYSTNFVICGETENVPHCISEKNKDLSVLHWHDLATEHAVQGWRLVPNGFGAALEVSKGKQWVIVINLGSDASSAKMEAMVLREGTKLIVKPNTIYATIALENSALKGEYYLASHTLTPSLHGLINSFIMGSSANFEDDIAPMFFIRRMVHYFHNSLVSNAKIDSRDPSNHLLAFEGREDLKSLFSLFGLAVFMNALDKRTYRPYVEAGEPLSPEAIAHLKSFDRNSVPPLERCQCAYARGLARELMAWFCSAYIIDDSEDDLELLPNLLSKFIVHTAVTMVQYKRRAAELNRSGCCSPEAFELQVAMALMGIVEADVEVEYYHQLEMLDDGDIPDLDWDLDSFTMSPRDDVPIQPYGRGDDYMVKGINEADRLFFKGFDCGIQMSHEDSAT